MSLPAIGITMGDAAGIGPEVIAKALAEPELYARCRPLVIGDGTILARAIRLVGSPQELERIGDLATWRPDPRRLSAIDLGLLGDDLPFGKLSAQAGDAAYRYIEKANELALAGRIDAVCTAPLNKEALHAGGHRYPGHTEIFAELSHAPEYAMMLTTPKLRVIHVTTHIGLIDAIKSITPERVHTVIALADATLRRAGVARPRIGVCGINPHAGEHGLFGYGEEERQIEPAVARAQGEGIAVEGPLPADTLFFRAVRGDFDVVVAMYHDQGHGPIKVLGIEDGVNVTVGLPYVRTSVDHGTAFDIAGTGAADARPMLEALRVAIELAPKPALSR